MQSGAKGIEWCLRRANQDNPASSRGFEIDTRIGAAATRVPVAPRENSHP